MRRLLTFIFVFLLAVVLIPEILLKYPEILKKPTPCNTPIHWKLGTIDSRFNLPESKLIENINKAEGAWESPMGQKLFIHDPSSGDVTIRMVFDERQSINNQINTLENQVKQKQAEVTPQIEAFQKRANDFKTKLADLNKQIEEWNSKGGAPPEVFDQLVKKQGELRQEAQSLNDDAKKLNLSADQYNAEVNSLNQTVNTFSKALDEKPEEGIYDSGTKNIDVYFYVNDKELVHTLAHELGHAMGLMHIPNQKAIMYPNTTEITGASVDDIQALKVACGQVKD